MNNRDLPREAGATLKLGVGDELVSRAFAIMKHPQKPATRIAKINVCTLMKLIVYASIYLSIFPTLQHLIFISCT